jgi:tetratricopeptide (TPR) repeat protein
MAITNRLNKITQSNWVPQKKQLMVYILLLLGSCKMKNREVSAEEIADINLKKGDIVLCGPADKRFGSVTFDVSCSGKVTGDFNQAVALLHSFEYDEAEKVFAKIIDKEPDCAMAYWGVAMCNFHPIWAPATQAELIKGTKAIKVARSLSQVSQRESDYIEAIAQYYAHWDKVGHYNRCINFRNAMERMYKKYPQDKEAAIFYALALDAASDASDKTFADQRKAGAILKSIYPDEPSHPGIVHYIIHTYDYPGLAEMALPAARQYASIAPASAHAQHMPSHIFTRLGLWDESIRSNLISTSSAKCYAENSAMKGHWDEELHGMDYLVYAYLQKGEDNLAREQYNYLQTIEAVYPVNFKDAYAFAAIPARYLLETKNWKEAARLEIHPVRFPWNKFPWQEAIIHFARALGAVHSGDNLSAGTEIKKLGVIYDALLQAGDSSKANLVAIQVKTSEAWIFLNEGKNREALKLMDSAADMEDATRISAVSPGDVLPARELLGDMLIQMGYFAKALTAYEEDLRIHPNRFNGVYGAALAAEKTGDTDKAAFYFQKLVDQSAAESTRPELIAARLYLKKVKIS